MAEGSGGEDAGVPYEGDYLGSGTVIPRAIYRSGDPKLCAASWSLLVGRRSQQSLDSCVVRAGAGAE